ncbi:alpha/beta hydrolase fold family protein [Lysobacter antibioticus]|uniref:alpha/beta fold hydrolase n=1 Tax=Lysobacter antibioticus TaxID=84531 RepID=UPI000717343C|nr:alpha/beta hydrolase [Lysobacter antibioticus]ALN60985.1 alpha/beta hydrolase fold family protein [Lysobacter antibioticus]
MRSDWQKRATSWIVVAALGLTAVTNAAAQQTAKPGSRAEATRLIADLRRIVTPEGVERAEKVKIGGIEQWVTIRGVDKRNPVLLMLHGGPGFVEMPFSWYFQRGWEDYFTVVQWDQRGAGKTYLLNDPAKLEPTMTRERMVEDTEEMVAWLRREFGKDKIFVLGHSWGSVLGLEFAQRRPQWLHAYIGMGQVTNSPESERRGLQFALDRAQRDGNAEALRELASIEGYAQPGKPPKIEDLYLQRKWLGHYGGAMRSLQGYDTVSAAVALAPEYSDAEIARIWEGNEFSEKRLLIEALQRDYSSVKRLDCPVILFNGRDDYNVSSALAAEWFGRLQAPSKQLVWFERSAHVMFTEEPGKTLVSLVRYARPIAERAGDVAPE